MVKFGDNFKITDKSERDADWLLLLRNAERVEIKKGKMTSRYGKNYSIFCDPSVEECDSLFIVNMNKDLVGSYAKNSHKWFEVIGYESPLDLKYNSTRDNRANYNPKKKSLYIRENVQVEINCSAYLWTSGEYKLDFRVNIDNCDNKQEQQEPIALNSLSKIGLQSTCSQKFNRNNKTFSCSFTNLNEAKQVEELVINLEVEYGPEYEYHRPEDKNKTITAGTSLELICYIKGYPIKYQWTEYKNKTNILSNQKNYALPTSLEVGKYNFECEAKIDEQKMLITHHIYVIPKTTEVIPSANNVKCKHACISK